MNSMRLSAYSTMMGQTIVAAVTSESKRFFLGTDSASHERQRKECSCGCAGIYNAPVALSLYAMVCEELQHISVLNFSRPSSNHAKMTSLLRSSLQLQTLGV